MKKKTTTETLASNLRHLMDFSGFTITELVKRSGVSRRTIAYILKAENSTSIETAEALAKPFGLEGWHLIMHNLPHDLKASKSLNSLISNYIGSSSEGQNMIDLMAEREARIKADSDPPTTKPKEAN